MLNRMHPVTLFIILFTLTLINWRIGTVLRLLTELIEVYKRY